MSDALTLEVRDLTVNVLTGIYSQETHLPQPLRISVAVEMAVPPRFAPDTPLSASHNYMHIKAAASEFPPGLHFTLIEAVADHIAERLFAEDARAERVTVRIVKLAIAEADEEIGITLSRARPASAQP